MDLCAYVSTWVVYLGAAKAKQLWSGTGELKTPEADFWTSRFACGILPDNCLFELRLNLRSLSWDEWIATEIEVLVQVCFLSVLRSLACSQQVVIFFGSL